MITPENGTIKWDREDVQRVLYHVVRHWQRCPDDELTRSAIYDVAIPTLRDNDWWSHDDLLPRASTRRWWNPIHWFRGWRGL